MAHIVSVSGSPTAPSRTLSLSTRIGAELRAQGFQVHSINVRDLPAEDLLHANLESPALKEALGLVERADGIVLSTPLYKASYTGVLKAFLDLLPQFALTGKVVLPIATGGSLAHVLALDYALRPVLQAVGAQHVVGGFFVLDKLIQRAEDGAVTLEEETQKRLSAVIQNFADSVRRHLIALPASA
jgi:FMN reductase